MKNFDMHRFATLLKWHLAGNRREILNVFLGLAVGFFVMVMFFTQVLNVNDGLVEMAGADWMYIARVHQSMAGGVFCIAVTVFVGAARIFRNMKDTPQRTTFLMLPASNLEKWLLRFLHATVLTFLLACAALVAADVVRMLIAPLWGKPFVSGVAWLLTREAMGMEATMPGRGLFLVILVSIFLVTHATFVLGGTLFRKNPFLLTWFVVLLLAMLVGKISISLADVLSEHNRVLLQYDNRGLQADWLTWVGTAIHYLLAIAMYWLSYKVFTRMQVINNKWLNV